MKSNKMKLAVASLAAAGLIAGCGKRTPNTPPEPDTETHLALEAAWALHVVTDIEMMCAYAGVNETQDMPYTQIESQNGTVNEMKGFRDPSAEFIQVTFNQTKSRDGRFRDGGVRLHYGVDNKLNVHANPNSNYYHEYGFAGLLNITGYSVDSNIVTVPHPGHGFFINRLPKANQFYDDNGTPTPLKWEILSKFHIQHQTDTTGDQDIWLDVALFKVLENAADTSVYNSGRLTEYITWDKAVVGYYGRIEGTIGGKYNSLDGKYSPTTPGRPTGGTDFTIEIRESQKLIRDFTCVPDRARGVTIDGQHNLSQLDERHSPFIKGVASFKPGDKYPRQIYFGNESNTNLAWQCDNTGEVMIKGIAYRVNFRK